MYISVYYTTILLWHRISYLHRPECSHDTGGKVFVGPGDQKVAEGRSDEYSIHQCIQRLEKRHNIIVLDLIVYACLHVEVL